MNNQKIKTLLSYLKGKNKSGVYFSPEIPEKKLRNAMKHHDIAHEDILVLFDYTFFGSATESLLLSQQGMSFVVKEKEPAVFLKWAQIQDIYYDYDDGKYIFFLDEFKNKYVVFDKYNVFAPDKKEIDVIRELLLDVAHSFESYELSQIRLLEGYFNENKFDELLRESKSYLEEYSAIDIFFNEVIFFRAYSLLKLGNIKDAWYELEKIFTGPESYFNDNSHLLLKWPILEAKILNANKEYGAALDSILTGLEMSNDWDGIEVEIIRKEMEVLREEYYNKFCKSFLESKDERKKVLLVHDDFPKIRTEKFFVLSKSNLPNIKFPFGHPKVNEVYISHPFKENLYYPVDEMEFRVFADKIEEYSLFLQSLGAREITIDTYKNENLSSKSNVDSKAGVGITFAKVSSSNNMESNQENESYNSFQQRFNKAMKFSPLRKPHLPEGMVWYPVEPSWQRLYSQRMNGNIVEYEEMIKTSHENTLSEQEMLEINSEINHFFNKAKINRKRTSKSSAKRNKEIEWKVKVVFAPIEELKEDVDTDIVSIESPKSADSVYSSDELSFMDLIKTALSDSEISDDEMRIIDRQRDRMGISEVRAKELIDSIQRNKSFSPEEVEFIEEIEFCLSDDGQISEDELNLLDRLRVKLNISEDRSKELIGLFFNKNS